MTFSPRKPSHKGTEPIFLPIRHQSNSKFITKSQCTRVLPLRSTTEPVLTTSIKLRSLTIRRIIQHRQQHALLDHPSPRQIALLNRLVHPPPSPTSIFSSSLSFESHLLRAENRFLERNKSQVIEYSNTHDPAESYLGLEFNATSNRI
jgi:hypothetical protein